MKLSLLRKHNSILDRDSKRSPQCERDLARMVATVILEGMERNWLKQLRTSQIENTFHQLRWNWQWLEKESSNARRWLVLCKWEEVGYGHSLRAKVAGRPTLGSSIESTSLRFGRITRP